MLTDEIAKRYSVDRTLNFEDYKEDIYELLCEARIKGSFADATVYFSNQVL